MINLKKYEGPFGIPVYHQQVPQTKVASLGWLIITGGADDESIGSPGLHHWFEHVPFRGTKRFPRGVPDIISPFTKLNGWVNAWTGRDMTNYYGSVHETQWKDLLARTTDMISAPLLRPNDVDAERQIIHSEISESRGNVGRCAWRELMPVLFPGHAFAHDILGSEESLASMDAATLIRAHELGYDRSRAVFVSVGPMGIDEIIQELDSAASNLPDRGVKERRVPAYHGPITERKTGLVEIESNFGTTIVKILFSMESNQGESDALLKATDACALLDVLFSYGGMASPMMRIVREERHLAYGINTSYDVYPGGSHFGFSVMTKRENISAIIDAINDVIEAPELKSVDRLTEMKACLAAELEMMPIDPTEFRDKALAQFRKCGKILSYLDVINKFNSLTMEDVERSLQVFARAKPLIFVYKGMGKEE